MKKKTQKKKWTSRRHLFMRNLTNPFFSFFAWLIYGAKVDRFREAKKRQFLILFNHQTDYDQFFVGMAFPGAVYYVASEDLFSNGFVSSLLRFAVAPIPIKKSTTDLRAIINCLKVTDEGGTIAMAPEGNRTYSGKTCYIKPSVADLAKKLNLPIAIFRIEGGYGVKPRWSDVARRGRMHAYVSRVIEPEEYGTMPTEELYGTICRELYVDEAMPDGCFPHKKSAEYLERAVYVCPKCGLSEWESHGEHIHCKKCGMGARYLATKELAGDSEPFPFRFVGEWYDYQENFIRSLDLAPYRETPMYTDSVRLFEVILYHRKRKMSSDVRLSLFGDRYELAYNGETHVLPFDKVRAASVLGRNKLNIYFEDVLYQIKGSKRFNALKYVNIYYHAVSGKKGDKSGELQFLGL